LQSPAPDVPALAMKIELAVDREIGASPAASAASPG
jgi:hypothetical protein